MVGLLMVAALLAPGAAVSAGPLIADAGRVFAPFGAPASPARRNPLDPLRRLAQATPATPAPANPSPPPQACTSDAQCPAGTICESGMCRPFERAINILLFRKEGPATWVIPFYWSRRGVPGYRVIFPFYWHYWGPDEKTNIFAPFYWRFEDYLKHRVVTVVLPYVHTKQPDAESWAVWPLFYKSTRFGWAAPLLGSFKVDDPAAGRGFGLYAFLYFWKRSPTSAFDLGFPLFVSTRSTDSAFTFALPLNFYWRSGNERNLLVIPLLFRNRGPSGSLLVSPLGYYSTAEGNARRGSAAWLYWFGRRTESNYDVLFPLLWSFRSPQSNTTIVLPVLHFRRADSRFTAVLPVWFSASNSARGTSWQLFFPLFLSRTGEQGRSRLWLTPLGGYRRDDDEGSRALTFLVPPLIWRRDSQREFESYLLLFWRYRDLLGNSSTTILGPIYRHDDPTGSTRALLPLFWYFRDGATGATAHTFFPLYFRRNAPDDSTTAAGIFPLWGYYRRFSDGYSFGLSPLAFFGKRQDRRHALVLPIFYHLRDDRSSATVAFPVFYRFTDAQHESTAVPPLLYFQGRDHADSYRVQFPLFWRFRDGERGTTTTVVPPIFYRSRPDGWSAGLAPLLFAGGGGPRRHFVLFPLFWRFRDDTSDTSTVVALNYLHRRRGGEVTDALFPLFHYRRGAKPGGSDETSFTLFPLVHYRRDARGTVFVSPLGGFGRGEHRRGGLIGPYFWYGSRALSMRGIPPLYFETTRHATGERNRIIGPWFQMDAPGRGARILFPFAARYWDERDSGTYVFPTYFHRRTADGYTLDTVFPLFWISRAPGYSNTVIGPFFRRTSPGGSSIGLVPLFGHARNQQRRLLVTPLLIHHANYQEGTARTYAPLFFRSSRREGSTTVLFPLWWSGREKDRTHDVLFPVFWHFANQRQQTSWTLAGPFYWSSAGNWRTRGLMPLAWFSRNGQGSGSEALLPLFFEKHSPTDRLVLTIPFGFRSKPDGGWFYLGPFIYKDVWDSSFWTLFPLAFSHYDKVSETRTRVVPPLLLYHRTSPDRSLFGTLLLFWRHRDITSTTTLALPLFYDFNSLHDSRLTMLLPLFVRYRNQVTSTSVSVAPLFYRRTGPDDSTTVAFPLVWDFRGGDRRSTLVLPFYAGFRRPTWEGRYIFPNIWYRTGLGPEAGTSRLFVFPFWESAVKRQGDYLWEALMGLFGWERIGRNRYLKILFIPFELSPAPAASTAWYGKPPPASRRQRVRGLNTQTW